MWQPRHIALRLDVVVIIPVLCLFLGGFIGSFWQDHYKQSAYEGALKHSEIRYHEGYKQGVLQSKRKL